MTLTITADFDWSERLHGSIEPWHIWLEDTENEHLYHREVWQLHKLRKDEPQVRARVPNPILALTLTLSLAPSLALSP